MQPRQTLEIMFGFILKITAVLLFPLFWCQGTFAAPDLVITGKVSDATGKSIADAVVMVYHAGPTSGYSLFCPTCYADCGKRAITDGDGMFTFHHLSPDLWFELFVEKDGYEPEFVNKVVPAPTAHVIATLAPRRSLNDPSRIFRGRIVDPHGLALRDAVVRPIGALLDGKYAVYTFGVMAQGALIRFIGRLSSECVLALSLRFIPGTYFPHGPRNHGIESRLAPCREHATEKGA